MNLVFDVRGLAHWLHTRKSTQRIYSLLHLSARCMRALIMLCDEQRPASKPQQSAIYICWRMKMAGHIVCHNKNIRVLSWAQWTPLWHAHHTPPALQMRCSFHIDFYYLPLISDATHYKRHTAIYVQLIRNKNRFAVFSSNEHIECIAIELKWVGMKMQIDRQLLFENNIGIERLLIAGINWFNLIEIAYEHWDVVCGWAHSFIVCDRNSQTLLNNWHNYKSWVLMHCLLDLCTWKSLLLSLPSLNEIYP